MLTGYFDASGTQQQSDTLFVGGLVSTVDQWLRFEDEWSECLAEFGVPYLHMKEFAHFRGPFEDWRMQEQKRRNFLDKLSGIIARRTFKSFCRGLHVRDYEAINQSYRLGEVLGSPYALCGFACFSSVKLWHDARHKDEPILYVFEDGDAGRGDLAQMMNSYNGVNPIFRKKTEHSEFQAADWVVYENRRLHVDWRNKGSLQIQDFRRSGTILYERVINNWGLLGEPELKGIREQLRILPRDPNGGIPRVQK